MPAGTIALTNGSNAVTGTGTSFTTELKQGDFVYVTVGSAPYTLVVSSVTSNTQLTLSIAFDGPTTSGLAWNAVPASMQVAITQKILNDFAQVARGRILDFQNWQKIYSGDASVIVTRPDRTTFTGPSWGYMATQFANKANLVNDVVEVAHGGTGQKTLSGVMTWLGLGDAAFKNTGTTSGTLAAGNDSRLNTVNNKTGGSLVAGTGLDIISNTFSNPATGTFLNGVDFRSFINGRGAYGDSRGAFFGMRAIEQVGSSVFGVLQYNGWSVDRFWRFYSNGNAEATAGNWVNTSDERLKTNKQIIKDPLSKMRLLRGYSWDRLDDASPGYGFLAQDLEKVFPDAVFEGGSRKLKDGTVIEKVKNVELAGPSAALHHETLLILMDIVEGLGKRLKDLDGLDA